MLLKSYLKYIAQSILIKQIHPPKPLSHSTITNNWFPVPLQSGEKRKKMTHFLVYPGKMGLKLAKKLQSPDFRFIICRLCLTWHVCIFTYLVLKTVRQSSPTGLRNGKSSTGSLFWRRLRDPDYRVLLSAHLRANMTKNAAFFPTVRSLKSKHHFL